MPITPPAFQAVAAFPTLQQQVNAALAAQRFRVNERLRDVIPRPRLFASIEQTIREIGQGVIVLSGERGSGVTTLLCQLAVQYGAPFWLPEDDAGSGLEALCAQLLAVAQVPVPLVPPAARRDTTTLESALDAAARAATPQRPLVVIFGRRPLERATPYPAPFPMTLPPHVVAVFGDMPSLPIQSQINVGTTDRELMHCLVDLALHHGCTPGLAAMVVSKSNGSPLYVHLASGLLETGLLRRFTLPETLEGLHDAWWHAIDGTGRRMVTLLAAAGEPLPIPFWAELAHVSQAAVERMIERWQPLLEVVNGTVKLYHAATLEAVIRYNNGLAEADYLFVEHALAKSGKRFERLVDDNEQYLVRHLSRHLALSAPTKRAGLPILVDRNWVKARERESGSLHTSSHDAAWELRAVSGDGQLVSLVRTAVLAGSLTALGRTLSAEALATSVASALERGEPRDTVMRAARELTDQLPPNQSRAFALRRVGEVYHDAGMRTPAMRMLSEALDLEVPELPRPWVDEREETLVALARAAIQRGMPDRALGITTQISHPERRGMIETEVVRALLSQGERGRAEEVALAIGHAHTHEWAMAEVAVGHARAGNRARAAEVLGTLRTATAVAWARGELACDAARQGQPGAIEQIATITNEGLRERALALVVQSLVSAGQHTVALGAARRITDRDIRIRTLIDMALLQPPNAAQALDTALHLLTAREKIEDEFIPLMVQLCGAYATIGDLSGALQASMMLGEGEQRERAHSRIAVALARRGNLAGADQLALSIPDDDERDWTLHELARLRAEVGDLQAAAALLSEIHDPEEHDRAEADVRIAQARSGRAALALEQIALLSRANERLRALTAMAEALVQQNAGRAARTVFERQHDPHARSRFGAALAIALANAGDGVLAQDIAERIPRSYDRARALVALARHQTEIAPAQALQTLAQALRLVTMLGRSETFALISLAADVIGRLGGGEGLLTIAHALDELDSWWS